MTAILKREFTFALKPVLSKLTLVCLLGLRKVVHAIPVENAVLKVTFVKAAV